MGEQNPGTFSRSWLPKIGLAAVASASAAVAATATVWYLAQPASYEECMLAGIRDKPQNVHSLVDQICSRRWKELAVELPDGFGWVLLKDGKVSASPSRYSAEFRVTRASFRFSPKECAASSEEDFSHFMTRTAGELQIFEFDPPTSVKKPVCMQWKDTMVRYR